MFGKLIVKLFQVNAGPMAYAEAFLSQEEKHNYKKDKVEALKSTFKLVKYYSTYTTILFQVCDIKYESFLYEFCI